MVFVNWKLTRKKRTDILNQSDPDLLHASQSCQYWEKENTKDHPRGGCITAATASLFRRDSSSQPLSLSLLYKRTIVRETKVSCLNEIWFLLVTYLPVFVVSMCLLHSRSRNSSPSSTLPAFLPHVLSPSTTFGQRLIEKILYHLTSSGALPSRLDQVIILTFLSRCLIVLFSSSVSPTSDTFLTRNRSYLFSSYRHIHSPCYQYYSTYSISDIPDYSSILSNLVLITSIRESI